jgi:serine/threonine-protein kinase
MTLSPGTRLGPYEITAPLGAGGMGEVYKAKDTRLDRSVAIKVLPAHVSADPDRRARFAREAKTIAGLNHPHICTLHDVGEHDGTTFLVMELLTGETLAQRLDKGPLPLEQALTVATEIADALTAAHRQGVTHRDLKPGNVMLTKAGAKLLDFGLAKLKGHGEQPAAASLASAPTVSKSLTAEGAIIGTLQYMAPEQVEGKAADARTDLWALGAILYEMLTGRRAFEGTSAASLIGHIMNSEPPALATLQPLTPPALDRLVRQCLAKLPDDRPDTAHDVANDLRGLRESSSVGALTGAQPRRRGGLRTALMAAAVLVAVMIGAGVMWLVRPSAPVTSTVQSVVLVSPADELNGRGGVPSLIPTPGGSRTALTWTPDGQALVFVGRREGVQQLYVRRLDSDTATPLPNTTDANVPVVSPDGRWVAFWADGVLKKVPFEGGPVVNLTSVIAIPVGSLIWDAHGGQFFGRGSRGIWQIPAEGQPTPVTTVGEGEVSHTLPSLLPGGRVLLYTVRKRQWSWGDEEVVAQPLPTGERKVLLKDATDARYVPTRHLVFLRRGVLYAVPFDAERLELRGAQVAVLDRVAQALTAGNDNDVTGAGQFAVSATGTLAWLSGPVVPYEQERLVTVDRRGQVTALPADTRSYGSSVRVSPDQRRLAVTVRTLTETGLWVVDLTRPAPLLSLTTDGEASNPVWGPGGRQLVFRWLKDGRRVLATQPADGTAPPQVLASGSFYPSSVAPDGRIAAVMDSGIDQKIVIVTVENGKARVDPLNQTPKVDERWPEFSPDGHWLLYASNVTGRDEVYVRPYPGPGGTVPVSVEGGNTPVWHPSGREISFVSRPDPVGKRRMMAVAFTPGSPPDVGHPTELFNFDPRELRVACMPIRCYDVTPDGQRFYAVQVETRPTSPVVTHINLILNWFEELKAKVPKQ